MWTRRSFAAAAAATALGRAELRAQSVRYATITIPNGVPLSVWSSDFGATTRGDGYSTLRGTIEFRNEGSKPIRGLSLAVSTPPGSAPSASIVLPALDAAGGESFTAPVRLRLTGAADEPPWVEVAVDGCLAGDLSFSGPDRRNSRRRLTIGALEARRERARLKMILERDGQAALEREIAQLERNVAGPVTPAPSGSSFGTRVEASVIEIEGAPLRIESASARVSDSIAGEPTAQVSNVSGRSIRSFELGWAVTERNGDRAFAGSISSPAGLLAAGGSSAVRSAAAVQARSGGALSGLAVYVRNVEFADGRFWLPGAADLDAAELDEVEPLSNEALRLMALRDREGIEAVASAVRSE